MRIDRAGASQGEGGSVTGGAAGYVHEVFRSIQGEGPYVGVLQAFVRLAGCSARCRYCDTEDARGRSPACTLRGGGEPRSVPNPVSADEISSFVRALANAPGFHSVSLTGGEPLEQPDFAAALVARCRAAGMPVYLETNGLSIEGARAVAGEVDFVSLDIKLPSLCPGASLETYRGVLPLFEGARLFCKIVVAEGFLMEELADAARIVAEYDRGTTVVIQPATPAAGRRAVGGEALLACHALASTHLDDVRVIPQCHRCLELR
jgi:organic radical activating enzyme